MIILSWNCRGLGNLRAIQAIKNLIWVHQPDVILLFETLVQGSKIEEIRINIGFDHALAVDCVGRGGGLATLWRNTVNCVVSSYHQHFINLELNDPQLGVWRLTGFYGCPERGRRRHSWDLIRSISDLPSMPWCIIGDFNDMQLPQKRRERGCHNLPGLLMVFVEPSKIVG